MCTTMVIYSLCRSFSSPVIGASVGNFLVSSHSSFSSHGSHGGCGGRSGYGSDHSG